MDLESVLNYKNERVVDRFLKLYDIDREEAESIFSETLKFLWACSKCRHELGPVTMIDEMWHNFILFTGDYARFCHVHFDKYIHHNPADDRSRSELMEKARGEGFENALERQLSALCDLLGEKTVHLWYVRYPQIYNQDFYNTKMRSPTARVPERSASLEAGF